MALDRTIDAFRGTGYDGERLDLRAFAKIKNESVAREALRLVSNPAFVTQVRKVHTEPEVNEMKKSVYRACISHGVPLPSRCLIDARLLGVVVP